MASKQKRMFSSVITKQDEFLDMPLSAQALYFHLNMEADDEGFVANVKSLMRQVRCNEDDLKILIAKRYLISFESGVVVIKHWLIHNTIRQDRLVETTYKEEKSQLNIKENMSYTDNIGGDGHLTVTCRPNLTNLTYTNTNLNYKEEIKEIIDYINIKLNTRYRYDSKQNNKFIQARLDEGFTVQDFLTVIDIKFKEWYGTDMAKFLNPQTLFRPSNFEKYLNQAQVDGKNRWDIIEGDEF